MSHVGLMDTRGRAGAAGQTGRGGQLPLRRQSESLSANGELVR